MVPGPVALVDLPAPEVSARVDGCTVTMAGHLMTDMDHALSLTVAKDGQPVTDLQRFLTSYAALTAFRARDLEFARPAPVEHGATVPSGPC